MFFNVTSNVPLEKYLELPPIIGRGKKQAFAHIKNRIQAKLCGWKGKILSQAGRKTLIKSVAQAILVYAMNCFPIPIGFCEDINSMMRQFWWGQKEEEKKMHWLSWKQLCLAKNDGTLGFRDLKCFNLALLAKQCWRLLHDQDSLFYKVYRVKYFSTLPSLKPLFLIIPLILGGALLKGENLSFKAVDEGWGMVLKSIYDQTNLFPLRLIIKFSLLEQFYQPKLEWQI